MVDDVMTTDVIRIVVVSGTSRHRHRRHPASIGVTSGSVTRLHATVVDGISQEEREDGTMTRRSACRDVMNVDS